MVAVARMFRRLTNEWPPAASGASMVCSSILAICLYVYLVVRFGPEGTSAVAVAAVFIAASVSSIAGFAFSAICGAMLFHLFADPVYSVQIMMVCSVAGQALMVWSLRRSIPWRQLAIFLAGAAPGLPVGLFVLLSGQSSLYSASFGVLLVAYASYMLLRPVTVVRTQHVLLDVFAGFLGGVTGGLAAFPGAFVTIWCGLKGWDKERQRSLYQPFILIVQLIAIGVLATFGLTRGASNVAGLLDGFLYLPAMLGGCALGMSWFRRMSDRHFTIIVNWLLIASGIGFLL